MNYQKKARLLFYWARLIIAGVLALSGALAILSCTWLVWTGRASGEELERILIASPSERRFSPASLVVTPAEGRPSVQGVGVEVVGKTGRPEEDLTGPLVLVGAFKNGKKHGAWWGFAWPGVLSHKFEYRRGRLSGPYCTYYDDGAVAARGHNVDGKPHGGIAGWHATGEPAFEGQYVHGAKEGEWRYWTEDGMLDVKRSGVYEKGKLVRALPGD